MTQEEWRDLRSRYEAAEALPAAEQAEVVARLWEQNPALAAELQALLAARNSGDPFLDSPAMDAAALRMAVPERQSGDVVADRYELRELLGEGGFGRAFIALDRHLDHRKVVVKILKLSGIALEKHFHQEVQALSRLDHPGIVGVTDSGRFADGSAFLVMQYVPGRNLQELLTEGPMARERTMRLLCDMSEALAVAHRAGVLHRDLKPTNVIVRDPGLPAERAVLIDFGIARTGTPDGVELETTTLAGSPQYMAPEQLLGRASPASDVYSLGAVAFEMCVGKRLLDYTAGQYSSVAVAQALASVSPPLPSSVSTVIGRAVAIDPQRRISSVQEFAQAFHGGSKVLRRPLLLAALAIGVAGLLANHFFGIPSAGTPVLPVTELRFELKRRSPAEGEPSRAIPAGDVLHKGDQLELTVQAPEPGYLYAFDEAIVPGQAASQFILLFPGGEGGPSIAAAHQRIPQAPAAWLDVDDASSRESIWLVWSRNPISELESTRKYALAPRYGSVPDAAAPALSLWLHKKSSDTLAAHVVLPVASR